MRVRYQQGVLWRVSRGIVLLKTLKRMSCQLMWKYAGFKRIYIVKDRNLVKARESYYYYYYRILTISMTHKVNRRA